MRFATRAFLFSFIPFALLLLGTFWAIQRLAESTVRGSLRSSLRETHESIARLHARSELQNSRFLRVVADNAPLKAAIQLALVEKGADARRTLEDQTREISATLGFDVLVASNSDGHALAGVMRVDEQLVALDLSRVQPPQRGLWTQAGRIYQFTSIPVDQGDENLGTLSVGELLDLTEFSTPVVLARYGKVLQSSLKGISPREVESALKRCHDQSECDVKLAGATFLSLPMDTISFGEGYLLRSFQNVDSASGPVQAILRNVFVIASIGALLAASILGFVSSRSIVKPIDRVIHHLRESEETGLLPEFPARPAQIQEIRELAESFNRAATAIREGRDRLHRAYIGFVGSLANALDARDRYTSGHSRRVSELSFATARAMNVDEEEAETIRIGALLHDIGKIGIADSVLQKPGRLTPEEFGLIKQHPTIGRRILEEVQGFEVYLPIVELHHENWDGTGYPHGQRAGGTYLGARIVHVVDAYDAMTTDRPYRRAMTHEDAVLVLQQCAGTQFDAAVVETFLKVVAASARKRQAVAPEPLATPVGVESIETLLEAVRGTASESPAAEGLGQEVAKL